ncbi:MAG: DUF1822 family protein [Cyanobacteria bacterium J06627_28]
MSLFLDNPVQPILKLPATASVWQRYASLLEPLDPETRWKIYLHQLGWTALLPWLQSEFDATPQLWPEDNPWGLWQVVDGIVLRLGQRRLVVMLSEAIDTAEMRVPKEWVDVPDWAGDYFVAAQIDADEQQLRLWGYATRSQLKTAGHYDPAERSYCLGEAAMVQDFSAFWVAQRVEAISAVPAQAAVNGMAVDGMSVDGMANMTEATNVLNRLAQVPEPRLAIPFSQWCAAIASQQWQQQLYQQRQGTPLPEWPSTPLAANSSVDSLINAPVNVPVNLGEWIAASSRQAVDQVVAAGWQVLDLLSPQTPATRFRGAITDFKASQVNASQPGMTYGKRLTLTTATDTFALVLAISISIEPDERRNIRIQLYPAGASEGVFSEDVFSATAFSNSVLSPDLLLPGSLTLSLFSPNATEPLQTVQSGDRDNYIQLPPFRCPAGRPFSIRIQQADGTLETAFVS